MPTAQLLTSWLFFPLAETKSQLSQADLEVIESMVVAQQAEIGEFSSKFMEEEVQAQAQAKTPDVEIKNNLVSTSVKEKSSEILKTEQHVSKQESKQDDNKQKGTKSKIETKKHSGKESTSNDSDLTRIVADVASSMASTLESITAATEGLEISHGSSDEGEEQLMLMRDSPRWEDEEIQAEDTDEPRPIKAEIKLLVKTTEVGKESIEIRSIREFVDIKQEENQLQSKKSPTPEKITETGDRIYTLPRQTPGKTPSPKFVRSPGKGQISNIGNDEFDLMSQVRGKPGFWLAAFCLPPCAAS